VDTNTITGVIVDSAITVHKALGPGLLESTYQACLTHELSCRDIVVRKEVTLPVEYRGLHLDAGYRLDLLVNEQVIVELKAVERLLPIHQAQLLTYLKLSRCKVGLLINFNVQRLKDGIKRLIH